MAQPPAEPEIRGAVAFKATPTDDADTWDAAAAQKRVAEWATAGSGGAAKVDLKKYRQAFAYQTGDGTNQGDFHLPHHDIRNGKLVVVWRGVTAAMTAVLGGRGGVQWKKTPTARRSTSTSRSTTSNLRKMCPSCGANQTARAWTN